MRILVVEDDRRLSGIVKRGLIEEGYAVDAVFDGEEGEYYAENTPYDLIILDIMLPGINGFDICKEIKESDNSSKSFIIVVSARSSNQDRLYAHILGADCYLSKPFRVSKLIEVVKEVQAMQNKDFVVKLAE